MRLITQTAKVASKTADSVASDKIIFADSTTQLCVKPSEQHDFFETKDAWCFLLGQPHKLGVLNSETSNISAHSFLKSYTQGQAAFISETEGRYLAIIYRKSERRLAFFSDPASLQHAYYAQDGSGICLSTAIVDVLRFKQSMDIDRAALDLYLTFQYVPHPYTMFMGVLQLPLQAIVAYNQGALETINYALSTPSNDNIYAASTAPARIKQILLSSLDKQLPSNARRVGAFLSGGMDTSTNITLLSGERGIKPIVFTAGFREATYDETPYAKIMAEKYNLEHHILTIDESALENLETISSLYDNPVADRAILPEFIICKAAQELGVDYMLSGEGGDEVMGYPRNLAEDAPLSLSGGLSDAEIAQYYYGASALMDEATRSALLAPQSVKQDYLADRYDTFSQATPFEKIYYGQWQTWLIDGVLMKDLQLFQEHKLSFVSPFISRTLMQYMATIPLTDKLEGLRGKAFVKSALGDALPDAIINKVKHKFHVPVAEWFQGDTYDMLHDNLLASDGFCTQYMNADTIRKMLTDHKAGRVDYNRPLWALLFITLWYKAKKEQFHA